MQLKQIIEAALLAAGRPLSLDQLQALFDSRIRIGAEDSDTPETADENQGPDKKLLREVLEELSADYEGRGIEICEVGSGFRIQVRSEYSTWVSRLFAERPPKYSRALLETLALIAYRQPITRGEIEDIRGVSVSTNIIKTLTEREWVRVVGHRDVPGKPALYATTKEFLDYFNLKSLSDLPTLAEIRDLESINRELELKDPDQYPAEEGRGEVEATPETDVSDEDSDDSNSHEPLPVEAETETDAALDLDTLIESDPDGETDSGVMHQPQHQHQTPVKSTSETEDLSAFESDGETDALYDDETDETDTQPQTKPQNENK